MRNVELHPGGYLIIGPGFGGGWDFGVGAGFAPVAEGVVAPEPVDRLGLRSKVSERIENSLNWLPRSSTFINLRQFHQLNSAV